MGSPFRPWEISSVRRHSEMGSLVVATPFTVLYDLFETLQVFLS